MPAPETLSFSCPHCNIRLTVPASLAGVTGPCPSCKHSITAPRPEPAAAAVPSPAPVAQPLPVVTPEPIAQATPSPPAPAPPVAEAVQQPAPPVPDREEPVLVETTTLPPTGGPKIRPEPRNMKERGTASPIAVKHTTGDEALRRPDRMERAPRSEASSRMLRLSGGAAFCAAATVVSYMLCYFYLPQGPGRKLKDAASPLAVPAPKERAQVQAQANDPAGGSDKDDAKPQLVTPQVQPPRPEAVLVKPRVKADEVVTPPATPAVPPPGEETDESPSVIAGRVLDTFLTGKDAASRVGLVEPAATVEELNATILKGPLPEIARILPDLPQQNAVEQYTDHPYRVSFFMEDGRNVDYAMLVRRRGNQPPKVFLPAFLDLTGGRLEAFTREPNDREPASFHVVLDPLSVCHDETVPAPERKITFKLLPSMFGKEISRAYVSSGSRFAQMVGDPNSSLRWGVRMRATVTLQWNKTEDPQKPYLELMNIKSLSWE